MNFSTTANDFTTLKNGIDARLEIIQHIETGFYNITKTAKLVNELKSSENGSAGIPADPSKRPNHWFSNESTKELLRECLSQTKLTFVHYKLHHGTRNEFKGTYVHKLIYDQFLAWLDAKYAIKIAIILDEIHTKANERIIEKKNMLIEIKDKVIYRKENTNLSLEEKIDRQNAKLDKQSKKLDRQSAEIAKLLGYAKNTKETLDEVQDDLTETKEEVKIAKSYLEEKSKVSTKNPTDESKHHYFAATTYLTETSQVVKFTTGQKSYVDKTTSKFVSEDNHKLIVKPFYNANGIDLRQNVHEEFIKRRADRIKEINEYNAKCDNEFNQALKLEIPEHNKANPENKRMYSAEKKKTPLVRVKDISVKFNKLSFTYTINPYMGFNEVLQIIIDVNGITQESPLQSDEE